MTRQLPVNEGKYRVYMNSDADEPNEISYEEFFGDSTKAEMIKQAEKMSNHKTNQYGDPIKIVVTSEDNIDDVVWTNQSVDEDKVGGSNVRKDKSDGDWEVMSGKTGKPWPQNFKTKKSAKNAIKAYHASQNESLSEHILKKLRG